MNKKVRIKNKRLIYLLAILSILGVSVLYRTVSRVKAEERTWSQTDWRGGVSSSVVTNDVTTFLEESNIEYSNEGYFTIPSQPGWQLSDWTNRVKISFDNTLTNLGTEPENLTDFPVHIKLEDGVNIDYSKTNDDGSDIRFVDTDDTELSYEIDIWDESSDSFVWVKVPQIDTGDEDYIYMYYGNTSATDNQNVSDVWSNGYNAVFHNNNLDSTTIQDSVADIQMGKRNVNEPGEVDAVMGKAQSYDGVNDYSRTNTNFINNPSQLTIASWFRHTGDGHTYECALHRGSANSIGSSEYWMGVDISDYITATIGANTGVGWAAGQTSVTAVDGQWYYVVATWDGSVVSVYIDGQYIKQYNLSNTGDLLTPTRMGSSADGTNYQFKGEVDEMLISEAHRTRAWIASEYKLGKNEFNTFGTEELRYPDSAYLVSNIFDTGTPSDWANLTYDTTETGTVTVKVRSSNSEDMSGATGWESCDTVTSGTDLSDINSVTDEQRYVQYRVDVDMSGSTVVPLFNEIGIQFAASDQTPPVTNASSIYMGNSVSDDQWINFKPTMIWTEGADDPEGNGLEGYCIALDEVDISAGSQSLDPAVTGGVLDGLDDGIMNDACPYIVSGSSVDFDSIGSLDLQANKKYYFSIKAVDYTGNLWNGPSNEYQDLAWFRYDDVKPDNVMYISTPSSVYGNINDMFFNWPVTGSAQAADGESGLLGWQYAVNSSGDLDWRGTEVHPELAISYIPVADEDGLLYLDSNTVGEDIIVGNNTIYFRSVDISGNYGFYVTGGLNYGGAAPDFPPESVVTVSPESSESNEFALSWSEGNASDGRSIESYYYMINIQPPSNINTLKNNSAVYVPTTETTIATQTLVGAVKGTNEVYVVCIDDEDNYSPSNAISGTFTLNSENPDPPLNFSISDTSIKDSELWRVALTWEEPVYKGNGDISYIVEKSLDNESWVQLDRVDSLAYSDVSDESMEYYYRVATVDSSDDSTNDPSYSISQSIVPEGRFTEPPELISEIEMRDLTARSTSIHWVTDRVADSKVQIGLESNVYFDDEMYRSDLVANHRIDLTNLSPGTQYYYRVKWTDEDGNTGVSEEKVFVTDPAPSVEDVYISSVGLDYSILDVTVKGAIEVNVLYGKTKNYGASKEINTSASESEYSIMLTDLEDGTDYHYTIILTDVEGYVYPEFGDLIFTTPPRPQVSNIQIQEKKDVPTPTVEVFWESNIEISSIVKYTHGGKTLDKVDMEMVEGEHMMEISNLVSDTDYQLTVEGVDEMGNRAVSDIYSFTTATDTRPPQVTTIKSEGDVQSSDVQSDRSRSAQLVISWETDEPSTSQVLYGEGASGDGFPFSTQTDSEMRYKHVIIVSNLSPSKVYHFKVVSKDSAGNTGESGSVTAITPKSTETVIESVLGSLSRIFGFL